MRFTTEELAAITGGEVFGRPSSVEGASIDSRSVAPLQLFVPIVAARDGHDFIRDALANGATTYLTSGPIEAGTAVRVQDTGAALTAIGGAARDRLGGRVVGVTGSVGKTSVKDLLRAAAGGTWQTTASVGSFNNELGVPLTLINAPDDTECAVIEMGARGVGHIEDLCRFVRPTVGVVTRVAGVHLENFRTIDEVARGKGELVASLPADGTAVLNADDERVAAMATRTQARVLTYGEAGEVRASDVALDDRLRPSFQLHSPWGRAPVRLAVAGRHQVSNALAAAAAALAMGADVAQVAAGLGQASLSAMRMDLVTLPSGLRVLNDAYNANPTSMKAALDAVAELAAGRRIAVLGTMAELGEDADALHAEVAAYAAARSIEVLSVAEAAYGLPADQALTTASDAVAAVRDLGLGADDVVLVKGSRSAGLEAVVDGLRA